MNDSTKAAIAWAFKQKVLIEGEQMAVNDNKEIDRHLLVDLVRDYFNKNNVKYRTFSFKDLEPYL